VKVTQVGDWKIARKLLSAAADRVSAAAETAVLQEAHFFRGKIVEGLREQAPGGQPIAPPAATTLAVRQLRGFRGEKSLLVRGDLRNAITITRVPGGVLVGVLRTAKNREGKSLLNIAERNEHGGRPIVLQLTEKARRFLHAAFRKAELPPKTGSGVGLAILTVRARPFIGPVFERYGQPAEVQRRFFRRVIAALGGDFGTGSA
jgi:hypothetical protein